MTGRHRAGKRCSDPEKVVLGYEEASRTKIRENSKEKSGPLKTVTQSTMQAMAQPSTLHLEKGQREERGRNVERPLEGDREGRQDKETLAGVLRSHVLGKFCTFLPHPSL